jgi:hypothetical protein
MNETTIRAAFAPARALEPTDAEVTRVLARTRRGRRRTGGWSRPLAIAVAASLLLVGGGYAAAPPIRAAVDGVAGTFSDWLGNGGSDAPGRPLRDDERAPAYFRDPRLARDPRVIAQAGGYKLLAARDPHGDGVEFDLGNTGVGLGEQLTSAVFRDRAVYVLGPGSMQHADAQGHVPLFGITARSVRSVELVYASGPPLRVRGIHGGFVLLAQPERGPRAVVVFDRRGREIGRQPVDDSAHHGVRIDWSDYVR